MATWRDIAPTEVDPESPVTSTLMAALADNPSAIAEGASGAPKIAIKSAFGAVNSGNLTFAGLGAFSGAIIHGQFGYGDAGGGGASQIQLAVSDNDVTYYGTTQIIIGSSPGDFGTFQFGMDFATGLWRVAYRSGNTITAGGSTLSGASLAITSLRLIAGSACTLSAMILPNGGDSST